MRILCVFGKNNYGDPERGHGVEYASFIPALIKLGHEVEFFDSWDRSHYENFLQLNKALLNKVDLFKPRVMLTVQTHFELWLETLQLIKNRGDVATVSWATDDSWKYEECSRFIGHAYHAMTTTYPECIDRYHADGITKVLATQWGITGQALRKPRVNAPWKHSVSFIGSTNDYRVSRIVELSKAGFNVDCFGFGWPSGPVEADLIPEIMNDSCISLNFAYSKGKNQLKARIFEITGSGSLLFTEPSDNLEKYFKEDDEIVVFRNSSELIDKIRFFLENPEKRNELALAGYHRTVRNHTYERRMKEVIEFAITAQEKSKRLPDDFVQSRFNYACKVHKVGFFLRCFRRFLLSLSNAMFGAKRGPRAARKLVYEISWRLRGEKTYSAAGLPGRLFFHAG